VDGALAVLRSVNDPIAAPAVATRVSAPGDALAVKVGACATPAEFVVIVAVVPEPGAAKPPEGPTVGALKVTGVPPTGTPSASLTVTDNGVP
jgi:hypothetical protein